MTEQYKVVYNHWLFTRNNATYPTERAALAEAWLDHYWNGDPVYVENPEGKIIASWENGQYTDHKAEEETIHET